MIKFTPVLIYWQEYDKPLTELERDKILDVHI